MKLAVRQVGCPLRLWVLPFPYAATKFRQPHTGVSLDVEHIWGFRLVSSSRIRSACRAKGRASCKNSAPTCAKSLCSRHVVGMISAFWPFTSFSRVAILSSIHPRLNRASIILARRRAICVTARRDFKCAVRE